MPTPLGAPSRASRRLALVVLALALGSCKAVQSVAKAPVKMTEAVLPSKKPQGPSLAELSNEVLRFADRVSNNMRTASAEFARQADTPEALVQSLTWSLEIERTAIMRATGPNPVANLLDMLVFATVHRIAHEEHWLPTVWGEADRAMLQAFQAMEGEAYRLVERYLGAEQLEEVRGVLREWRERNPEITSGSISGLPSFRRIVEGGREGRGSGAGLLGLLQLDPLAGLEPAAREVALTRQFAERMLFWAQRIPWLIRAELTLQAMQLGNLPEVEQVLSDSQRISQAAASLADTVARLPEQISAEREAAVRQVSEELAAQRAGLVRDLETAREPLRELLERSQATLSAGEAMSSEVAEALRALDGFVARFDAEPDAGEAPAAASGEPGRPFDVTEYGAAAERIGGAAAELRALVAELDASLPEVQRLVDEAARRGEQGIDHTFWRGLQLGLILIAAAAGAALLVRRLGRGAERRAS